MIIYLHGFNSAGSSSKAAWLKEHLAPITVLAPTYPAQFAEEAVAFLHDYIRHALREHVADCKLVLVGSSLGGFYAQYLAPHYGAGLVLINPTVQPEQDLLSQVGAQRNEATGEEYVLDADDLRAFARFRVERCNKSVPTLLLLDEADEVLDYCAALEFYQDCGNTIVYPGGSHRFDHLPEALEDIRRLHDA